MQQAGPLPERRRFHCREQDRGGAGRLRVLRMKAVARHSRVTAALGGMQVGEDCSAVLNLIQEIQAQSTLSDAHVSSSEIKSSDKASFKNIHVVKDDSAAFLHLVKREYISEPPRSTSHHTE